MNNTQTYFAVGEVIGFIVTALMFCAFWAGLHDAHDKIDPIDEAFDDLDDYSDIRFRLDERYARRSDVSNVARRADVREMIVKYLDAALPDWRKDVFSRQIDAVCSGEINVARAVHNLELLNYTERQIIEEVIKRQCPNKDAERAMFVARHDAGMDIAMEAR